MKILHSIDKSHGNKVLNNRHRSLLILSGVFSLCLTISACGQRGNLFIPTAPEAAQRSTIGDLLTKPTAPTSTTSPSTPPTPPAPENTKPANAVSPAQ